MDKLNLEILKLVQEQRAKIELLTQRLKNTNDYLIKLELEVNILSTCLYFLSRKYDISREEKKRLILQILEEAFSDIFR